jgi:uncharacterized protein with HEPN domain
MADLPERDQALLLDMLLAAQDGLSFVEGLDEARFAASRLHQNAVIRSLEVIGEAAGKVSLETQDAHPEIPWREITGMRHRLRIWYSAEFKINSKSTVNHVPNQLDNDVAEFLSSSSTIQSSFSCPLSLPHTILR